MKKNLFLIVSVLPSIGFSQALPQYRVENIPVPNGYWGVNANQVTKSGYFVGLAYNDSTTLRHDGFIWKPGEAPRIIPRPTNTNRLSISDVASDGRLLGSIEVPSSIPGLYNYRAVKFDTGGNMSILAPAQTRPLDGNLKFIDNTDTFVGSSTHSNGPASYISLHRWLPNGTVQTLIDNGCDHRVSPESPLMPTTYSCARGWTNIATGQIGFPQLSGNDYDYRVVGADSQGRFVGLTSTSPSGYRSSRWDVFGMEVESSTDVAADSYRGTTAGYDILSGGYFGATRSYGFLYTASTGFVTMNSRLLTTGYDIQNITSSNADGFALGVNKSDLRYVALVPVPEPASMLGISLGIAALLRRRKSKVSV